MFGKGVFEMSEEEMPEIEFCDYCGKDVPYGELEQTLSALICSECLAIVEGDDDDDFDDDDDDESLLVDSAP